MSLSLYVAATVTAVTMDEVKAHIRVDFDDDDALIGLYADAAASYAFGLHGWTGRALVNETYEQTFDCWPYNCPKKRNELRLGRATVQSITSITYLDTDGVSQTLAADQYRLLGGDPGLVVPAYDVTWPSLRETEDAVTVRYVAGFGASWNDVPQDLRLAIAQLAAHWYENREPVVIGQTVNAVPDMYDRIFGKYKVWGL